MTDIDAGSSGGNLGAAEDQMLAAAQELGVDFPDFYTAFLRRRNGIGPEGNLLLYSTDDIVERNETFEVQTYAPGYLAIGDDSGGRSLIIGLDGSPTVYLVEQGSMDPDDFLEVSPDFAAWLDQGAPLP
ncbi:SMI1/KNR4 family protein [Longimicrobium terrae]|uniref:Knr4/Smi1-like domain-containing protein n=1 Tax=Longimicrobium terrae TaxID=1639882 RepID=A0A841H2Z9_9BACT|nr:hypothetical protein [Longimicrobium terrae]MBB6072332.1 hypothetical protein [Longimicrobium terrae]